MVQYLRVANVMENRLDLSDVKMMNFTPDEQAVFLLKPGDILLNEGQSPHLVGRPAMYRGELTPCFFQNTIVRFRANEGVLPGWALLVFRAQMHAMRYKQFAKITTNIAHLGAERFAQVEFPLPPVTEQRALLEAFEAHESVLDAAEQGLKRVRAKLKHARASVLKAAVEGRLVPTEAALARAEGRSYEPAPALLARVLTERRARWAERGERGQYKEPVAPEPEGLPELPEGWTWATTDQVCAAIADGDHLPPPVTESGVPFLVIGDVRSGQLEFAKCRYVSPEYYESLDWKRRPDSQDLLYTVVGSLGIPVRILTNRAFCVQRHIAILKAPNISTAYLYWSMQSVFIFRQATAKATGTAQQTLGLGTLRTIVVPLPPLAEQARIVAEVDRRMSVLDQVEALVDRSLSRCASLRQSILKRAFEGRLVPPSAEVTPE